jgi:HK97 family phage major capsid protein
MTAEQLAALVKGAVADGTKDLAERINAIEARQADKPAEKAPAPSPNPSPFKGGTPDMPDHTALIVQRSASMMERSIAADPWKGKGFQFAQVVRAVAISDMTRGMSPLEAASEVLRSKTLADAMEKKFKQVEALRKSGMVESDATVGGAWVPDEWVNDFIGMLDTTAALPRTGIYRLTMARASLKIPKLTSGVSVGYIGERMAPPMSTPGTGQMGFTVKKMGCAVVMSKDLIRDSAVSVEPLIRNRAMIAMGLKLDITGIRSKGGEFSPTGLRYLMKEDHAVAMDSDTPDKIDSGLIDLIGMVEDSNVPLIGCGWLMTPRAKRRLMKVRHANTGHYPYRDELKGASPTLHGYPVFITNQIPNDLNNGHQTEITFGAFPHFYVAENMGIEVKSSDVAAYRAEGNTIETAFSNDELVIQLQARHDFQLAHEEAFACWKNFELNG